MHQVYLVPGFFGFDRLGGLSYFRGVEQVLGDALAARGLDAQIIQLDTGPTSSIRRRSLGVMQAVVDNDGLSAESLHFVGHSTGGLDVRLLLSPGVQLDPSDLEDRIGVLTRSVSTLSTPHFGTPMANFFTSMNGRNLLYLLTTMVTSDPGRTGAWLGARALTRLARLDDLLGQRNTVLDTFAAGLLSRIRPDRGNELWDYLREMSVDQGAMVQLTPEAIDLFNASVLDRDDVDYVSFVTTAPPPGIPHLPGISDESVYESVTHGLFHLCYWITSREPRHYPYPSPESEFADAIQAQLPFDIGPQSNDGVVPTFSQAWGRLGGVFLGDHLDGVGQFTFTDADGLHEGWLNSRSGFDQATFEKLWNAIADVIANAAEQPSQRASASTGVGS